MTSMTRLRALSQSSALTTISATIRLGMTVCFSSNSALSLSALLTRISSGSASGSDPSPSRPPGLITVYSSPETSIRYDMALRFHTRIFPLPVFGGGFLADPMLPTKSTCLTDRTLLAASNCAFAASQSTASGMPPSGYPYLGGSPLGPGPSTTRGIAEVRTTRASGRVASSGFLDEGVIRDGPLEYRSRRKAERQGLRLRPREPDGRERRGVREELPHLDRAGAAGDDTERRNLVGRSGCRKIRVERFFRTGRSRR
mmetsp:Transcript_11565/g.30524  ORF Transcript_11565/g.30524 Transcript_11565/m.30524 type:complete len:257 (-) Transcript_11565:193-963(-)